MDKPEEHLLFIAHIKSGQTHPLEDHLQKVAQKAAEFASEFSSANWAALAGNWHDLGKFRSGFQRYIRQSGDPDAHIENQVTSTEKTHSAAGALWAQKHLPEIDKRCGPVVACVLSYLIAGHHAGLDDWFGGLLPRFQRENTLKEGSDTLAAMIPATILKPEVDLPLLMSRIPADQKIGIPGRFALWVRMLFSCLVDADFLDTEVFMSPDKASARQGFLSLQDMEQLLSVHMGALAQKVATQGEADSPVNRKRAEVLRDCLAKAAMTPGVFSLTVPTGGGKTLSSLAFALRHALSHGKRRIVYAIPYTSIIEQTVDIFRDIFGEASVIEHHSNVEMDEDQETNRSRLACENWDAPLIVTTNVQLLESLFARRTSRCRKLHNLANSIIVLDEAQLLPVGFLQPVVDVLRLLVKDYGVSLVLCTATQPALTTHNLRGFESGEIREIVDDVSGLYSALDRVHFHLPVDLNTPRTWSDLASNIVKHDAVLAVVGRRADARALYTSVKQLTGEDADSSRKILWHLSGLMCAQHRSDTITAIKQALLTRRQVLVAGETSTPIRVISTQLVEAGVDIDFPVVYRALAGLDSIAQAAGRCNREGRLKKGDVYVFVPPKPAPPGLLRMAASATRILWNGLPQEADRMGVARFSEYFRRLYGDAELDEKGICELLRLSGKECDIGFRTAAERFRLIDEADGSTVFVRYRKREDDDEIDKWLNTLKKEGPERWLLRKLQRYGVTLYKDDVMRLLEQGDIEALGGDCPGLYVQSENNDLLYHPVLGINVDGVPGDPRMFVY
ncbi:CRISPR-associated helicase Cas3 [Betaproteobacteria bacterium]|nr:CRISPR-associated helicase Cas3 [Betaproteobacteria bacterium]